jgi:hypothetical protein
MIEEFQKTVSYDEAKRAAAPSDKKAAEKKPEEKQPEAKKPAAAAKA